LESELFGYEAGAFTGAQKPKPGKFELAHRSTLLLDEIGEMSPGMQAKLLHVLQDGNFSRLGARVSSQVDVRVLAATNVNLEEAIAKHRFREDLYYRLNAFSVRVPALRERREEIPHLIREMLKRSAVTLNREPLEVSPQLVELAQEYSWPGNLRELRNFITRLLVLRDEKTAASDLAAKLRGRSSSAPATPADVPPVPAPNMRAVVRGVKDQAEMRLIGDALRATSWNRRRAAANLQISYRALLYKIQQYGLAQDSGRELVGHSQMSVTAIDQGSRPLSSALTA
jgi:transcriptional regulator with PAS, ATPase and Fis domain